MSERNTPLSSLNSFAQYNIDEDCNEKSSIKQSKTYNIENNNAVNEVSAAERFINKEYLNDLRFSDVATMPVREKNYQYIKLYRIQKIIYALDEDPSDKLLSIYNSVTRFAQNIILLIKGTKVGAELYIGIRSPQNATTAGEILHSSYIANFPGSIITPSNENDSATILTPPIKSEGSSSVSILSMIPALRNSDKSTANFTQGLEKFIDTMRGHEYLCELLASPVSDENLTLRKQGLEELYSALYPYSKRTMSHGHNDGITMTTGVSESISHSISHGISLSTGTNKNATEGTTEGTNIGASMIVSFGFNQGRNESYSSGKNVTKTNDEHEDDSISKGKQTSKSSTKSVTDNLTIELKNKSIDSLLDTIDKHIKRMEDGYSYGMWECAAYFITPTIKECAMAAGTFKALMAGDNSGFERAHVNYFDGNINADTYSILEYLKHCLHPQFAIANQLNDRDSLFFTPTGLLSGKELPLLIGFPRKSVNGLPVTQMAAFGRDIHINTKVYEKQICIGNVHFMNHTDENVPAFLNVDSLSSHCFITGSTGSGKSNTVYKLIECLSTLEQDVPFLVIEPAKGEYKSEFALLPNINIFTANPFSEQFLKLNPFYFNPKIHVLEHLDRLIEIFNACWEMYAAMPAILKDALERAYINKGWDLINSVHKNKNSPEYPTFMDLLEQLPVVINESGYSADTKGDYKGALITRIKSLTNGIYGQIFCDVVDIDEKTLFDSRTIIDLSRIGSSETKSLLMGILVLKLSEYRMSTAEQSNAKLQHITVLEEAHNLLKNTKNIQSTAGNTIVSKSVEMITACIAEMRTYGEGFIIVDQSPTSVDISAIKNTNTKIVMRLPEKDDCELAGAAMALSKEQIAELSKLDTGVAVIMQNNWTEAVLCKIDKAASSTRSLSQTVDVDKLMSFRSMVANALVDHFIQEESYDESRILEQIELFDINSAKKTEMKRYIQALTNRLKSTKEIETKQHTLGLSITKILGFEDAFKMAEKKIRRFEDNTYDPTSMQEWRDTLIRHLHQYVDGDARHKKRMFQYMLFAQDNPSRQIDYGYLYRRYYVR